jgi:amidase
MVALAHGNDAGGSLRIPASCCGIVGLKPTRARVSQAPDVGAAWGIGTTIDGMLSRTVRDTAAALDCMAGGEPGDPFPAPSLPRPLAEELDAAPGSLRIGVLAAPPRADVAADADATAAVERAARLLEAAGHGVELAHPAALGDEQFLVRLFELMAVDAAAQVADWSRRLGRPIAVDELELGNAAFLVAAREITAARYAETLAWMHAFQRRVAAWWAQDGFDLLLSPVLNGPPAPLGMLVDPLHGRERALQLWQYTPQFNVTGQPAISLPLHWTADDLPIGVQLVASYGREDLLVRVAAQLERSAQWSERRPAVRA